MAGVKTLLLAISAWLFSNIMSLPVEENTSSSRHRGFYEGFQVLQVRFNNQSHAYSHLQDLVTKYKLDVWGRPSKESVDVMVNPKRVDDVIQFLHVRNASYNVKVDNVQRLLEESRSPQHPGHRLRRSSRVNLESVTRRYLRFGQMRQILRHIQSRATQADVTLSVLGRTFEGRPTPYVTIRQRNSLDVTKQIVVIEAGMHAREWIAPAMALNIIYKLSMNPDNDTEVEEMLEKYDWIIIPVSNPDGYIHSMRNITTRMWRKTMTTLYAHGIPYCYGVDGNRNFGFQWTDSVDKGGSSNPCDDNFSGPQGFSEPETRNLRSLVLRLRGRISLFISLHSFGQFFLYPWGYDSTVPLEDEEDMIEIAQQFAEAMLQRNRWYETGSSAQVLYPAAGASDDFARGEGGVKYTFTIELSPSDSGHYGFLLPPRFISEVVDDHWPAFKTIARTIWNRLNETTTTTTPTTTPMPTTDNDETTNGDNSDSGLTNVVINGHTFQLDLSDPAVAQWMQYYMELLRLRSRFYGEGGSGSGRQH